jgi:hypothetical protein
LSRYMVCRWAPAELVNLDPAAEGSALGIMAASPAAAAAQFAAVVGNRGRMTVRVADPGPCPKIVHQYDLTWRPSQACEAGPVRLFGQVG